MEVWVVVVHLGFRGVEVWVVVVHLGFRGVEVWVVVGFKGGAHKNCRCVEVRDVGLSW